MQTDEYKLSLIDTSKYIWKRIIDKSEQKVDVVVDRKLKSLYLNGKRCGKRKELEVIQEYKWDQLTYEFERKVRYRAFLYVSSFSPLVVHFSHGYMMLER